jgi:cyclic beta-1,2-glucan synthetase
MATTNHCATDLTQVPSLLGAGKIGQHNAAIDVDAAIREGLDQKKALLRKAQSKVHSWKATPEKPVSALEAKWNRANESIRVAGAYLRERPGITHTAVTLFANNQSLIQTCLKETRSSLAEAQKLPQVQSSDLKSVPRAFAAGETFLRAVHFEVSEDALIAFLRQTQEEFAFQMGELWTLQAFLQLALVERIGEAVANCQSTWELQTDEPVTAADRGQALLSTLVPCLQSVVELEWERIFQEVSLTEQILRRDPLAEYQRMDVETLTIYRDAVRKLAEHSRRSEQEVAIAAVELAQRPHANCSERGRQRRSHVGYYLLGEGKGALKQVIEYRSPVLEAVQDAVLTWPNTFYFSGIALLTLAAMALFAAIPGVRALRWYEVALFVLPAMECAVASMNLLTTMLVPAKKPLRMDFSEAVPRESTSMVVIPMLLGSEEQVKQAVRDLEVRYLANRDANIHFALLTDPPDSMEQFDDKDALAAVCSKLIEGLNRKYASEGKGTFYQFHRNRSYNPSERSWMGWERKRGKLLDLNNLLLGKGNEFSLTVGDLSILREVRYVITLDLDTQLPRDSARKMVGALAHPLNRAVIDPATNTVVEGYGILQPRVEISVKSKNRSRLAGIFSGDAGLDVYARAISDVYQDLFGEGIFTGKGIYEVEAFQQVLHHRFPCNAVLSHDLLEGAYTRVSLLSDVEVIDDYPSHVSAYSRRKHRWVRGDWQIIRWLLPRVPDHSGNLVHNPLRLISRWKIVDNVRRSLTEFSFFLLLLCGWMVLPGKALYWALATLLAISAPVYIQFLVSLVKAARLTSLVESTRDVFSDFYNAQVALVFRVALLCHQSLVTLDAIGRTLIRMVVTRKRLLQWETAADAESVNSKNTPVETCLSWTPWLCLVIELLVVLSRPASIFVALPFLGLWGCSKTVCDWLNMPYWKSDDRFGEKDRTMLRSVSLRTWRFFREFSNAGENWLIPDVIHEDNTLIAHRISPTNLGFVLNSRLAAYDFGWSTLTEFVGDIEKTCDTMARMPKLNGNFYNWYDTHSLEALHPFFVSTVDNGNLVCCLWTLKQACLEATRKPIFRKALVEGISDHLETILDLLTTDPARAGMLSSIEGLKLKIKSVARIDDWPYALPGIYADAIALEEHASSAGARNDIRWWAHELSTRIRSLQDMLNDFTPWLSPAFFPYRPEFAIEEKHNIESFTLESLPHIQNAIVTKVQAIVADETAAAETRAAAQLLLPSLLSAVTNTQTIGARLNGLAETTSALAKNIKFDFLYNPTKKQLSIGYDGQQHFLHGSHYDLLASEARAAVFVAIAKGEIPEASWFHLGRSRRTFKRAGVLLSWSGTMFEYLLPSLWMKSYPNTLLEECCETAVRAQQSFAEAKSIPWGISEASCCETNPDGHYRYHAFGLRSLALSRDDGDDLVVSPYSAFLALLVDSQGATENIREMKSAGWVGDYGFYDACDFTPSRMSEGKSSEVVRCWMAHHQGMCLVAAAAVLCDMSMQKRFHAEPMVAATERILQEKLPRGHEVELELTEEKSAPPKLRPASKHGQQQLLVAR